MKSSRFLNACRDCRLPRVAGRDFDLVSGFASTWASQDGRQCTLQTARHPSIARHSACVDGIAIELVSRFASTRTSRSGRPGKSQTARHSPCVDGSDDWKPEERQHQTFFLFRRSSNHKDGYSVPFSASPGGSGISLRLSFSIRDTTSIKRNFDATRLPSSCRSRNSPKHVNGI